MEVKMKEKILPELGTIEECKHKMHEAYINFVDIASKFISLAEFYSAPEHKNIPLNDSFRLSYNYNFQHLKESDVDEFIYQLSFLAVLSLDYIDDIEENLRTYHELMEKGSEAETDYDKCCDYLACRDGFIDQQNDLLNECKKISKMRSAEVHQNDELYDPTIKHI